MRLTDFDTDESPRLPMDFVNNMKHTSDFDDMSVPYFDRLAVLVMEGIATPEERAEYAKLLSVSEKNQESASLYTKCRLKPDFNIQMPDAQSMKRQGRVIPLIWKISAAAAVLAFGIFGLMRFSTTHETVPIHGIASSTITPTPREVFCVSSDTEPSASAIPIKSASAQTQKNTSAKIQEEPTEEVGEDLCIAHASTDSEMLAMAELTLQINVASVPKKIEIPVYEPTATSKPRNATMAFFRKKLNRFIDAIPSPVEIVRDENDEVAELSFTAFNRTFSYRRQL